LSFLFFSFAFCSQCDVCYPTSATFTGCQPGCKCPPSSHPTYAVCVSANKCPNSCPDDEGGFWSSDKVQPYPEDSPADQALYPKTTKPYKIGIETDDLVVPVVWGIGTLTDVGDLYKFEPFDQVLCSETNPNAVCTRYDSYSQFDTSPNQEMMGADSLKWVWFGPQPHTSSNKQVKIYTRFAEGRVATMALVNSSEVGISTGAGAAWQFKRGDDLTYNDYCYFLDYSGNSASGGVDPQKTYTTLAKCRQTSKAFATGHRTALGPGKRNQVGEELDDEDLIIPTISRVSQRQFIPKQASYDETPQSGESEEVFTLPGTAGSGGFSPLTTSFSAFRK
jgi:hypothetical protein